MTRESKGVHPSLAIKFLLDYHRSVNLFAMPNFTGRHIDKDTGEEYESFDFFHKSFYNRVERFTDQCSIDALEQQMLQVDRRPYATGISYPSFWTTGEGVAPDGTVKEKMHIRA